MELLGDHFGAGLGVQKAVADDLADDFAGTAVVGFGTGGFALEGRGALFLEGLSIQEARIFSLPSSKLVGYVMPALAPAAALLGPALAARAAHPN